MSEETNYKNKFENLSLWMEEIVEAVKKDLRNDHLKQDFTFVKKYLGGQNIHKVEVKELAKAYQKAIQEDEKGESIAEFIAHRWIYRNSEMYEYFAKKLSEINPEFTQITSLTDVEANKLFEGAAKEFGYLRAYLFSVFNGVAFSKEQLSRYMTLAKKHVEKEALEKAQFLENLSIEEMKSRHANEIARITDKYEKKLIGMQKKWTNDVDLLKKQLANLQRKTAGV